MKRRVDADEGLAEVNALWSASTADELHRVLVLHQPIRGSADAFEPFALLQQHHEREPASSMVTALLLLTDRRWGGGVGHLVRMIETSQMLSSDDIDLLARLFLDAADAVYWEIPDEWFSDGVVIVLEEEITDRTEARDDVAQHGEPVAEPAAVARRAVSPPLRRWAAAWVVRHDASMWSSTLARSSELDSHAAAAVISGLLDVRDALAPEAQRLLVHEALRSGNSGVRRLGYAAIAERDGGKAAYALARSDRNARVRVWARTLIEEVEVPGEERPRMRSARTPEPPTLF